MCDQSLTSLTFEHLKKRALHIGYGEITVKLIVNRGRVVGYDETQAALVKFRAQPGEKEN